MKRAVILGVVLGAIGLVALACDDDHYRRRGGHYGSSCSAKTTCGTCTPVVGCGWCASAAGDGTGTCVTDPDDCEAPSRFNWDPEDCPAVVVDGGAADAPVADSGRIPADAQIGEAGDGESPSDPDGGDEAGPNDE